MDVCVPHANRGFGVSELHTACESVLCDLLQVHRDFVVEKQISEDQFAKTVQTAAVAGNSALPYHLHHSAAAL